MKFNGVLNYPKEMCILSGIWIWAKKLELTAVWLRHFSSKHGLMRCSQHLLNNLHVVIKINWVFDYHIGMCILSRIYVWAKVVGLSHFSAKLGLMLCMHFLLNELQYCNETQGSVRLPYCRVLILRNLCLQYICSHILLLCCQQQKISFWNWVFQDGSKIVCQKCLVYLP